VTYLRRRGVPATVYKTKTVMDPRGNEVNVVDMDNPYQVHVWVYPQRSTRAEVVGQQHIEVTRIGVDILEDVDLWGRVDMLGKVYDIAAPAAYHHGTRHTRHWSFDLRERTVTSG
jgi:hypothetical protein